MSDSNYLLYSVLYCGRLFVIPMDPILVHESKKCALALQIKNINKHTKRNIHYIFALGFYYWYYNQADKSTI